MSKLMYKHDGGFHHFPDGEVEGAIKAGWVDGEPIMKAAIEAKAKNKPDSATIANPVETVTIPAQQEVKRSPGRPRNVVPSVLNDGEI